MMACLAARRTTPSLLPADPARGVYIIDSYNWNREGNFTKSVLAPLGRLPQFVPQDPPKLCRELLGRRAAVVWVFG